MENTSEVFYWKVDERGHSQISYIRALLRAVLVGNVFERALVGKGSRKNTKLTQHHKEAEKFVRKGKTKNGGGWVM